MEGTTSFYVILHHTRVVWSMSHNGGIGSGVECSGRLWMMVQGNIGMVKKRKEKSDTVLSVVMTPPPLFA